MNTARDNYNLLLKEFCRNNQTPMSEYNIEFHGCFYQSTKNGKKNGPFVAFWAGTEYKVSEILYYKDDQIVGSHKIFSIDGKLIDEHKHDNNNIKCKPIIESR